MIRTSGPISHHTWHKYPLVIGICENTLSFPEPSQFQPILAHSILWWIGFKYILKGHVLFEEEMIFIDDIKRYSKHFFIRTVCISSRLGTKQYSRETVHKPAFEYPELCLGLCNDWKCFRVNNVNSGPAVYLTIYLILLFDKKEEIKANELFNVHNFWVFVLFRDRIPIQLYVLF